VYRRRAVSGALCAGLVTLCGCTDGPLFSKQTFELASIDVLNATENPQRVAVTVHRDGKRVLDASKSIPVNEDGEGMWRIRQQWMGEPANYTIEVSRHGGREATVTTRELAESTESDCLRPTFQLRGDGTIGTFGFPCEEATASE
jgi:hypothetical protein